MVETNLNVTESLGLLASDFASGFRGETSASATEDFSRMLASEISLLNDQVFRSDEIVREFALGKTDNLHQVMISLEQTKIQFELAVQIRNRLLEAYQDIMRMQI